MESHEIQLLNEAFFEWLRESDKSKHTLRAYGKTWFNKFPHSEFNEASEEEAQDIINDFLRKKRNNNRVARGFLKKYLEWIGKTKSFDVPKHISRGKNRIPKYLSVSEIKLLEKAMEKESYQHWLAFMLIYEGGLRRSELLSVKYNSFEWDLWADDPTRPIVLRVIGKGDKERLVSISASTITQHLLNIQNHFKLHPEDMLVWLEDVKKKDIRVCKFKEQWFYKWLRIVSKKNLGRPVNPHLLRHSRATHLLDKGVEIKDIQNYLGHANISQQKFTCTEIKSNLY